MTAILDHLDVYVSTRLAFLDRPDVRICQRENPTSRGVTTYAMVGERRVIEHRFGQPVWDGTQVRFVAMTIDDYGLASGFVDRECVDACATGLRASFDARIGAPA